MDWGKWSSAIPPPTFAMTGGVGGLMSEKKPKGENQDNQTNIPQDPHT